ncbi:uncharacterized protein LOC112556165 isoform X1 [Pomacea canaliculata]|uniref:uncharacterized protein LOC112556165 isoform X1 n=1 Tax=Pomacea canaliculata TaxID=400727 RepID=UPI000D73A3A4|nr:uncharacterized protein LOC112556165 isoform X1 [Pomacea canaliculata]XP_025080697.1 uncharacterized protein LOC112556165 isoform X1 [Pomacea canaliculata]XP_025080698.1 uncharacterized protein LOC112556165 isoform X1 [Pomacea canaliculata]
MDAVSVTMMAVFRPAEVVLSVKDGECGLSGEGRESYIDDQGAVCKGQVCGKKTRFRKLHGNASWDYKRRGKRFVLRDFKGRPLYKDKNNMAFGSEDAEEIKPHNFMSKEAEKMFQSSLALGDQHGKDFSRPNSLKGRQKSTTNLLSWGTAREKNWFKRGKKRNCTVHKLNGGKANIKKSLPSQSIEMTEFRDEERDTDTTTGPYVTHDHSVSISGRMMKFRELEAMNISEIPSKRSRSPSPTARHSHRTMAQRRSPFPRRWENRGSPFNHYSREEWLGSDRQDSMEHERSDFALGMEVTEVGTIVWSWTSGLSQSGKGKERGNLKTKGLVSGICHVLQLASTRLQIGEGEIGREMTNGTMGWIFHDMNLPHGVAKLLAEMLKHGMIVLHTTFTLLMMKLLIKWQVFRTKIRIERMGTLVDGKEILNRVQLSMKWSAG